MTLWIKRIVLSALALMGLASPAPAGDGVANLPYSQGRIFSTLDEYLAHLESLGPIDVPYYKQVAPGIYEQQLMFRRPGDKPVRKSRSELARELGFTR